VPFATIRERDPYLGEYFQWLAERIKERSDGPHREPYYKRMA
jgi:hypothetical protein